MTTAPFAGNKRNGEILAQTFLTKCAKHLTPPSEAA